MWSVEFASEDVEKEVASLMRARKISRSDQVVIHAWIRQSLITDRSRFVAIRNGLTKRWLETGMDIVLPHSQIADQSFIALSKIKFWFKSLGSLMSTTIERNRRDVCDEKSE